MSLNAVSNGLYETVFEQFTALVGVTCLKSKDSRFREVI
jgi:hypothetical protein